MSYRPIVQNFIVSKDHVHTGLHTKLLEYWGDDNKRWLFRRPYCCGYFAWFSEMLQVPRAAKKTPASRAVRGLKMVAMGGLEPPTPAL